MSLWDENVSNIRFIAWDTETTGLSARSDEIVEIAALAFDEDFEHREFHSLIKPNNPIPKEVIRIHGIDDATVVGSPPAEKVFEQFFEFLGWAGQPRVLVAHNASFDVGMVHGEWLRQKSFYGSRASTNALIENPPEICIDSCQLSRALLEDQKSHSMASLTEYFGIEHNEKHRARSDVRALKALFMKLLEIASDKHADASGLSLRKILQLCGGHYELHTRRDAVTMDSLKKCFRFSPELETLAGLCGSESAIAICYDREESWRYITPLTLKNKNSRVYLEAYCHRDQLKKTFRGDRIRAVGKMLQT